jgi:hypothetical protein
MILGKNTQNSIRYRECIQKYHSKEIRLTLDI